MDFSQANTLTTSQSDDKVLSSINAISDFKLPAYGTSDSRMWFSQIEDLFIARNIRAQTTKYAYVVSALPIDVAAQVGDLIEQVPESDPYDKIKAALIQRTSASDEKRLQQLLTSYELGDKKPSQLLRYMKELSGPYKLDETLLKVLWFQRLPHNVRQILTVIINSVNLTDLADMADRITEIYPDSQGLDSVQTTIINNMCNVLNLQQQIMQLTNQLETLRASVAMISTRPTTPFSRRRSCSRHRSKSPKRATGICWYHQKYGERARRCTKPCTFPANSLETQGSWPARK
ncbi:unnamed protein product [Schistosoma turkestanicum]|nr:unnamed protein product [Schistosoma turkestanicum]